MAGTSDRSRPSTKPVMSGHSSNANHPWCEYCFIAVRTDERCRGEITTATAITNRAVTCINSQFNARHVGEGPTQITT